MCLFLCIGHYPHKKNKYDYICLLQPTSPLRKKNEIDNAIKKIIKTNSDSLISLCKLDEPHPYKLVEIKNKKIIFNKNKRNKINNRQQMPDFYMPSGNIYITKRNILLQSLRNSYERKKSALASLSRGLETVSPLSTLDRGYSITFTSQSAPIKSADRVKVGDKIRSHLYRGNIESIVSKIEINKD